jgi:hypothetical protein
MSAYNAREVAASGNLPMSGEKERAGEGEPRKIVEARIQEIE